MPLSVVSNFAANLAHRHLGASSATATSSLAKLSAGTRVLSAKDDAASLSVGNILSAEIGGLKQAAVNAGQGAAMLQVADGAMTTVNDLLLRMKALSVQAGSGQLSSTERTMLDTEFQALISEIDRVAHDTAFAGSLLVNGKINIPLQVAPDYELTDGVASLEFLGEHNNATLGSLLYLNGIWYAATREGPGPFTIFTGTMDPSSNNGTNMLSGTVVKMTNSASNDTVEVALNTAFDPSTNGGIGQYLLERTNETAFTYKVGTGASDLADDIAVTMNSINATALGVDRSDITTASEADLASTAVSDAIDDLQVYRAVVGANQNRLGYAVANLTITTENLEAARSQLLDLDTAAEMSRFTSSQILVEAGVSMLAQATQLPQSLLRLFS